MNKFLPKYTLFLLCLISFQFATGQTTLINPAADGGFENGTTWAVNNWTVVNGAQTNQWWVGTAATGYTGARCAYIGTASTNNTYSTGASTVAHFYRDITFPAGQPNVTLSFNWKGYGESGFDYMRVYLVPTTTTPVAGTLPATGQLGGDFNMSGTWQTATLGLPCNVAGTTMRLIFSWRNDASIGSDPPACIDNISLVSNTSSSCNTFLGTGVTTVASLPYSSGAGTTCGMVNDLTPANTATCGSGWYLDGEDRVWVFTPTASGQITINLDAPSASYTGLMLYLNCPVTTACATGSATCIAYAQSSTGSKSFCATVTAGSTYYLVLDSWPSPACNAYSDLTISAVSTTGPACSTLLGTGVTNVAALPYNSGAGTTCGSVNNLTPVNTNACGATYYLDGEDRVWVFTPSVSGQITINLDAPAAAYTGLMLYRDCPVSSGCGAAAGVCIANAQDYGGSKSICVNVIAGSTYYLILDSWPSPNCNPYTNLSISAPVASVAGATCANAISIPALPYSVNNQTTACAGNDYTGTTTGICNAAYAWGEDKVYSFTATTSQCIGVSVSSASSNDITISVYQGCPGSGGVCIGSVAVASLGNLSTSVTLPGAGTYYIIIDSQNPTSSLTYNLQVSSFGSGAANDRPYQAQPLPFNIPIGGNNSCSGNADEPVAQPSCYGPAGSNPLNTVWYSFVAPASGCVKIRTTLGTLGNTQIAAYGPVAGSIAAGSGNTLPYLNCNQDLPPCGYNTYPSSELILNGLSAGMTYYISVDGYGNQTGSFTIFIMDGGIGCSVQFPPTPGQDCSLAFPVCKTNITVADPGPQAVGNICEFSSNINCLLSGERGSYWYTIRIVSNGFLEFNIIPNDWPGAPSTMATDYDFAVWKTKTAGVPGPANCGNLASVPPISCNYSYLGVTGCFSAATNVAPAAYPGFDQAYQPRIAVQAGDEYLLNVSNFTNSTSGFTLNFSGTSPIATVPPTGGTLVWTGTLNTDWYNPENWGGCAAPNCVYNVSISSFPVNQPSITGLTATCGSLDITMGASLTLQANSQLKVCGSFVNNGVLNAMTNSTVLMQSDSVLQNQTMTGGMTGTNKFWHLTVNKPATAGGNTVLLNNDLDNIGNFTLGTLAAYAGGIFNANGKHHRVGGHFNVRYASLPFAVYNATGSTLEFNGNTGQNYFNPGTLHHVVMNHTGTGVTLGNSTIADWMTVAGVLTLNQGKIITGANRVNVINTAPAAVTSGNVNSFVDGNLKRAYAPAGGSYDFPVGTALRGYQRINYNFGSTNDRQYSTVWFNNTAPATPAPFLGPECISALYDQAPLNHGTWYAQTTPSAGTAPYSVTAYNANYTNAMSGYTVMVRHNTAAWGLEGSCIAASPITAVQRTGMNVMSATTQFAIAQALSPLPVELLSFTAKAREKFIRLNWITGSEINNHGFEIHRSASPPDFEYIGWQPGAGTTGEESKYEFDDFNVSPGLVYYYKLRQIDFDGNFKWSDHVAARLGNSGFIIAAIPNPYSEFSSISVQLEESSEVKLEVFSKLGQLVEVLHSGRLEGGLHSFDFGASRQGYPAGVYFIKATINGHPAHLRLIETN